MDNVITKIGLYDVTCRTDLKREGGILEGSNHHAPTERAEITPLARRRTVGMLTCDVSEFDTAVELGFQCSELGLSRLLRTGGGKAMRAIRRTVSGCISGGDPTR